RSRPSEYLPRARNRCAALAPQSVTSPGTRRTDRSLAVFSAARQLKKLQPTANVKPVQQIRLPVRGRMTTPSIVVSLRTLYYHQRNFSHRQERARLALNNRPTNKA